MKKLFSILTIVALLWVSMMFVDYINVYNNGENLLIPIDLKVTDEYTKKIGLGYEITNYTYDKNNLKEGQVLKDFKVFGLVVSKEAVITRTD